MWHQENSVRLCLRPMATSTYLTREPLPISPEITPSAGRDRLMRRSAVPGSVLEPRGILSARDRTRPAAILALSVALWLGFTMLSSGTAQAFTAAPTPSNNRTFSGASNPNGDLYSGSGSGVSVTNVSNWPSTMTADLSSNGIVLGPTNDDFVDATELAGPTDSRTGDTNVGATKEAGEPNHARDPGGAFGPAGRTRTLGRGPPRERAQRRRHRSDPSTEARPPPRSASAIVNRS